MSALGPSPATERSEPQRVGYMDDSSVPSAPVQHLPLCTALETPEDLSPRVAISLLQQIDTMAAHDSPIRRIPSELLILVFTFALTPAYANHTRSAVASTCRQWRDIVLNTPQLWCIVDYTIRALSNQSRISSALIRHADRASPFPLVVYISLHTDAHDDIWPGLVTLYERAQSFSFFTAVEVDLGFESGLLSRPAPHLTHFAFNIDSGPDSRIRNAPILELSLDAPNLRSIECGGRGLTIELPSRKSPCIYGSVRALTLHGDQLAYSLVDIIRCFPNLVELDVYWYYNVHNYPLFLPPSTTLDLPHLETLTVDGVKGRAFFSLDVAHRLNFASLRKAIVRARFEEDMNPARIDTRVTAFMRSALRTARTLELYFDVKPDLSLAIVDGLEACAELEHLTFSTDLGAKVIEALSTPRADGTWLCPRLHFVSLHLYAELLHDSAFRVRVMELATARGATGLGRVDVHLKDSDSSDDLDVLSAFQGRLNGIISSS
ncbi:hypothetical protein EXIGLDRAFT_774598 [Exidia glandulosa HHB12029]|uniref:F-box domain-containing protein n=1 Tax=Exidia glandulosa HHB12029 TaxID=1314781 RepID=A0A165EAY2_EXIGL|nr:hypothetical protein EXIGLDRAFT_774598 [Exidia glandulosa HHB12029]